jgi:hypothetical protein
MTAGAEQAPVAVPGARRPRDFSVRLPPGWIRLPVDGRSDAAVAKLVALRFSGLPAQQRDAARHLVRRDLTDMVRTAAANGGLEVFLCVDPIRGLPVSAACVVTFVPPPSGDGAVSAADLLPLLGPGDGAHAVELTLEPVGGAMAARRRYRRDADPGREQGNTSPSTHVEYVVAVPGSAAHLMLSFSTVTHQLADALVTLFDAIAATLTWMW